jgi:hypothetical protein
MQYCVFTNVNCNVAKEPETYTYNDIFVTCFIDKKIKYENLNLFYSFFIYI